MSLEATTNGNDFTETWASPSEPPPDLPELFINPHDPTATAKELAGIIARDTEFLFNGNAPVRITAEDDEMPRAIEVTNEAVRGRSRSHHVALASTPPRRAVGRRSAAVDIRLKNPRTKPRAAEART